MSKSILAISSCIHLGEKNCREDLVLEFLEAIKELGASLALIGDTHNVGAYSGTAHQGSVWDDSYNVDDQLSRSNKLFKPLIKNIVRILPGNHEERGRKALSVKFNRQLAIGLGIPEVYRDTYSTLKFSGKRIFMSHGGSMNDFRKVLIGHEGSDVIALGHTHQLSQEIVGRRSKSGRRDVHLIRCGTFLEEPRYGKIALYPPNPLGAAWITVTGDRVSVDLGVTPRK